MAAPVTLESQAHQIQQLETAFGLLHAKNAADVTTLISENEATLIAQTDASAKSLEAFKASVMDRVQGAIATRVKEATAPLTAQVTELNLAVASHQQVVTELRTALAQAQTDKQAAATTALELHGLLQTATAKSEQMDQALSLQQAEVNSLTQDLAAAKSQIGPAAGNQEAIEALQSQLKTVNEGSRAAILSLKADIQAAETRELELNGTLAAITLAQQSAATEHQTALAEIGQKHAQLTALYNGAETVDGSKAYYQAQILKLEGSDLLLQEATAKITQLEDSVKELYAQTETAHTRRLTEITEGQRVLGDVQTELTASRTAHGNLVAIYNGAKEVEGSRAFYQDAINTLELAVETANTGAAAAVAHLQSELKTATDQLTQLLGVYNGSVETDGSKAWYEQKIGDVEDKLSVLDALLTKANQSIVNLESELAQSEAAAKTDAEAERLQHTMRCMNDQIIFLEGRVMDLAAPSHMPRLIDAKKGEAGDTKLSEISMADIFQTAVDTVFAQSLSFVPPGCYVPSRPIELGARWNSVSEAYAPTMIAVKDTATNTNFDMESAFPGATAAGCKTVAEVKAWSKDLVCPIPTGKAYDVSKLQSLKMVAGANIKSPVCVVELLSTGHDPLAEAKLTPLVLVLQHTIHGETVFSFPEESVEGTRPSQKEIVHADKVLPANYATSVGVHEMDIHSEHLLDDRYNADNAWTSVSMQTSCRVIAPGAFEHDETLAVELSTDVRSIWMETEALDPSAFMKTHQSAALALKTNVASKVEEVRLAEIASIAMELATDLSASVVAERVVPQVVETTTVVKHDAAADEEEARLAAELFGFAGDM